MIQLVPNPKTPSKSILGLTLLHFNVEGSKVIKRIVMVKEKELKEGETFTGYYNNKNKFSIEFDGVSITSSIEKADEVLAGAVEAGAIKLISNRGN